jgi:enamine deaminase RidA (YjgF/YER057c/UK114 family)
MTRPTHVQVNHPCDPILSSLTFLTAMTFVALAAAHSAIATPPLFMSTRSRLADLGIDLPPPPKAAANYVPYQVIGDMVYLSGHLPLKADGSIHKGLMTPETDLEVGTQAARQCGLNLIASLYSLLEGDLDRLVQVVKLFGIVQSSPDFHDQHKVLNGCSDLMVEVFGERGRHARSAIGTNALPLDIMVEVEAVVQIRGKSKE